MSPFWIGLGVIVVVFGLLAVYDQSPEGNADYARRVERRMEIAAKVCEAHGGFERSTGTAKTGRGWLCKDGTRFRHSDY